MNNITLRITKDMTFTNYWNEIKEDIEDDDLYTSLKYIKVSIYRKLWRYRWNIYLICIQWDLIIILNKHNPFIILILPINKTYYTY